MVRIISKEALKENFEWTAKSYVKMLCAEWHLDEDYGFWVGDDIGGVWCYGDNYAMDYDTIRTIIDQDVKFADYIEWHDYCEWAYQYNQTAPNFKSWLKGCPRLSEEVQKRLIELKAEFEKACKEAEESLF